MAKNIQIHDKLFICAVCKLATFNDMLFIIFDHIFSHRRSDNDWVKWSRHYVYIYMCASKVLIKAEANK